MPMINKGAIFSPCRKYRYTLTRIWTDLKPYCLFVCLNPSTADENYNDPTVRRCIRFAESFGYGGMIMVNLFAYRSTNPKALLDIDDPIGPDNDFHIEQMSRNAGLTVAAWGNHKSINGRADHVIPILKDPHCLALTKGGQPRHPLYLKKTLWPRPYFRSGVAVTPGRERK